MIRSILIILLLTSFPFLTISQVQTKIDTIAPFEEGLAGVEKNGLWGFIDSNGVIVIDYRNDIVVSLNNAPTFSNGMCLIQEDKDGVIFYGYINTKGEKRIPAEYLLATPFENGYARVIKHYKTVTSSTNALGKRIVYYSYNELLIDTENQTVQHLRGPQNLIMNEYELRKNPPKITSMFINDNLIAVRDKNNKYKIYNFKK